MSDTEKVREDGPQFWEVHWKEVSRTEGLAWFQATRRCGSAPKEGVELVEATAFDAVAADRDRLRDALVETKKDAGLLCSLFQSPESPQAKLANSIFERTCAALAALGRQPE